MNPSSMLKFMQAKQKFTNNHPKFASFLGYVFKGGIPEGTVIEISIEKPGADRITSNIRVTQEDLELLETLKSMK